MNYIVIETFPEPYIITDENENTLIFEDHDEAYNYMLSKCQKGIVVNITVNR